MLSSQWVVRTYGVLERSLLRLPSKKTSRADSFPTPPVSRLSPLVLELAFNRYGVLRRRDHLIKQRRDPRVHPFEVARSSTLTSNPGAFNAPLRFEIFFVRLPDIFQYIIFITIYTMLSVCQILSPA